VLYSSRENRQKLSVTYYSGGEYESRKGRGKEGRGEKGRGRETKDM
jgi:hypothetical protein